MKRKIATPLAAIALAFGAFTLMSALPADKVMTKEGGVYIVNTTELGKNVKGYKGTTPLKIHIKDGKVLKIESLKNMETPKYWARIKQELLDSWNGKTVKQAEKLEVDALTGATLSSNAVKENVKLGLEYYKRNK
ncbi:MAG: FMN-binding protein [Prevotella sp.]|jgi:uncharacterized protein with FMN-binding domain|nr:FMN-binding protein [Prevotella sp.]